MIDNLDIKDCVSCQACENICPKKCIKLIKVNNDFMYPYIDKSKCINCGLCKNVCPVINIKDNNVNRLNKEFFAVRNLDEKARNESSSGGIFSVLAEEVIKNSGVVIGAAFDTKFKVKHIIVDKKENIKYLRGSKYVQSDINNCYSKAKQMLLKNKMVLFSGCPCQVAALKSFLGEDYNNLYTIDFVCHGIPSQNTFDNYIKILENRYKSKIKEFYFRDKMKGWHNSRVKVIFSNGKIYSKYITEDMYMRGFLTNIYLKESCHNCKFKKLSSGSDITIADFWGAEIEAKDIDDNKGLSMVVINSNRGKELFDKVNDKIFLRKITIDKATKYNQGIFNSSKPNIKRNQFYNIANKKGYKKAFKKVCQESKISRYKREMRLTLGKLKRKIIILRGEK